MCLIHKKVANSGIANAKEEDQGDITTAKAVCMQ
jgi:hypothetical protein